jgi:benzodiazapine receptor
MDWLTWCNGLAKPSWTPSPSTTVLNWQILYPIIVITFGFVFVHAFRGTVPRRLAVPFAINLAANFLFMPIFAGLRNVPLAAADAHGQCLRIEVDRSGPVREVSG